MVEGVPKNWTIADFSDVSSYIQRGKSPRYSEDNRYPVINQKCIRWNGIQIEHLKFIQEEQWNNLSDERFLKNDDILWNSTGTGTIGRACLYKKSHISKAVADSHVTIVRFPIDYMSPDYVFYYIMSPYIQKDIDKMQAGSTNQVELGRAVILSKKIPVAPLNEQKRIVDKIEQLFSNIDEGESLLKKVQQQLNLYRQSVLKAAVTGELTKDWREANKHRLEPGDVLLKRILKARREQWNGRGKYKEPVSPEASNCQQLPTLWRLATIDQLSSTVDYGSSAKCSSDNSGVAVLRMGNIQGGKINLASLKYLPVDHDEFPRLILENGDLLFNRTNSAELVGKTAVYRGKPKKCSYASYLIRVKLFYTEPEYISAYINSAFGKSWIKNVVSQQVGQANVNGTKLKALSVPLPPYEEQLEIVQLLDDINSQIDTLEQWCASELTRSATLRQSILKDAFTGKLVPQDPNDEPASELLKRIQEERSVDNKAPKKKSPSTTPTRRGRPRKNKLS